MSRALVLVAAWGGLAAAAPARKPAPDPKPAHATSWDQLVGPIRAVEVTSAGATLVPPARELLGAEVGQPIDRTRLRAVLARVLAQRGVADVIAKGVQRADGVTLSIELVPQPTVHALFAHEPDGTDVAVPGKLALTVGQPLDPELVDAIAGQLGDRYLERGFVDVTVGWQLRPAAASQVDVAIEVVPGKAVTVGSIELRGNTRVAKDELMKVLSGELAAGAPWVDDRIARAQELLGAYYLDHGFMNASIEGPARAGEHPTLVFAIHEGNQYRIGKLELKGVPAADAKHYLALIGARHNDLFSRSKLMAGIDKVLEAARAGGFANVYVTPETKVDEAKRVVDVTLDVVRNP